MAFSYAKPLVPSLSHVWAVSSQNSITHEGGNSRLGGKSQGFQKYKKYLGDLTEEKP